MSVLILALAAAAAASPPTVPPRPPVDCHDAAHRALDFWIGDWAVFDNRSKTLVAHSRIEPVMDGCALSETYEQTVGPGGAPIRYHGSSYTALNPFDGLWKQFYVDTTGAASAYVGGPQPDGAMVLKAEAARVAYRMTYRRLPGGVVEQTGELSLDAGRSWAPAYDFTYRPASAAAR
jgi:hypothetical protein